VLPLTILMWFSKRLKLRLFRWNHSQ